MESKFTSFNLLFIKCVGNFASTNINTLKDVFNFKTPQNFFKKHNWARKISRNNSIYELSVCTEILKLTLKKLLKDFLQGKLNYYSSIIVPTLYVF